MTTSKPGKSSKSAADDAMVRLRLENQLCFALYSTSLALTKLYRPLLAKLKLTYPQYIVMLALWQQDGLTVSGLTVSGLTVSSLGALVALDSGTLTPLLKRLQAQGYVERIRNPQDEREVQIHLTAAGTRLRRGAEAVYAEIGCATDCPGIDRRALTRSLQRLRASLQSSIPEA